MVTKSVNGEQKLLFPECLSYILREQLEDGGWSSYSSPVNGILNSLASLLSLLKHSNANHRFDIEPTSLKVRIDKAKTALSVALGNWDVKSTVHVGFEILVPSFLEQLEDYGVFFEFPGKGDLAILNEENLARFPKMLIYANMQTTLLHSLEAFIGKIDFDRVGHQLRNGSMFGSPASTAAYLMHSSTWDNEAEAYLRTVYNRAASSGGIPSAFPSTVFESSWALSVLLTSGFHMDDFRKDGVDIILNFLAATLKLQGGTTGFAPGFLSDADDTAVSILALNNGGRNHCLSGMVNEFATASHFRTYAKESNPSFSANCNVLLTLLHSPDICSYSKEIVKATNFLVKYFEEGFVADKWNTSPNYASMLLCRDISTLLYQWDQSSVNGPLEDTVNNKLPIILYQTLVQIVRRQEEDGSWEKSAESTSYAVIAIAHILRIPWHPVVMEYAKAALQKGRHYLNTYPDTWVSPQYHWVKKVSYSSSVLSEAYCLAALEAPTAQYQWSPQMQAILKISNTFLLEMTTFLIKTPLFHNQTLDSIKIPLVESFFYLKRLQSTTLNIFPPRQRAANRYLQIVPFTWVGCNYLGNFGLSGYQLWRMMVLSVLIYQADEYMEFTVTHLDSASLDMLKTIIREACGCSTIYLRSSPYTLNTELANPPDKDNNEPNGMLMSLCADSHSSAQPLKRASGVLKQFIQYVLKHRHLVQSSATTQTQVAKEVCAFLLSHIRHIEDNTRFARQRANDGTVNVAESERFFKTFDSPRISYFDWVHTVATDDTSCRFAFVFFLALISKPGYYCLPDVTSQYLAQSLCLQLAAMCRQYNDYGSLTRDQGENNLNSLNFPEFCCNSNATTTRVGGNIAGFKEKGVTSMNVAKSALMGLAEY